MQTLSELWSKGAAAAAAEVVVETQQEQLRQHTSQQADLNVPMVQQGGGEGDVLRTTSIEKIEEVGHENAFEELQKEPLENRPPDNSDQLTLRRFFGPRTVIENKVKPAAAAARPPTRTHHLKPKRSILPHDLSEHWSTSRSAPSVSACPNGRRPISESETEFVTPVPMRKRATVAVEWRTPVITPQKPTLTGTRKKRHLITEDSFALKRPCWRVNKRELNS